MSQLTSSREALVVCLQHSVQLLHQCLDRMPPSEHRNDVIDFVSETIVDLFHDSEDTIPMASADNVIPLREGQPEREHVLDGLLPRDLNFGPVTFRKGCTLGSVENWGRRQVERMRELEERPVVDVDSQSQFTEIEDMVKALVQYADEPNTVLAQMTGTVIINVARKLANRVDELQRRA